MDSRKPPLLAVCGVKNSGKTTYLERLVAELARTGLRVAVIKHDGHEFQGDVPGTDSWRMYQAGAWGTAVCSDRQLLIHKRQEEGQRLSQQLELLAQSFPDADLILAEGMKALPIPKVELIRKGISKLPASNPEGRIGIVTDVVFGIDRQIVFKDKVAMSEERQNERMAAQNGLKAGRIAEREEFARITGYELREQETLYDLGRPEDLAGQLRLLFFSQGG